MDEATAELLRMYRERLVTLETALARLADENLRLRQQLAATEHKLKRTRRDCFCQLCLN